MRGTLSADSPTHNNLIQRGCGAALTPRARSHALRWVTLALMIGALTGCGMFASRPAPIEDRDAVPATPVPVPESADLPALTPNLELRDRLYAHYQRWHGTPYHNGGLSNHGVDCSGFVLLTYKAELDVDLPRTAGEQAALGQAVSQAELRPGDLVFFKTGLRARHVGIYLDSGRFIHASRRRGVAISALDDAYWRRTFWQARRIRG